MYLSQQTYLASWKCLIWIEWKQWWKVENGRQKGRWFYVQSTLVQTKRSTSMDNQSFVCNQPLGNTFHWEFWISKVNYAVLLWLGWYVLSWKILYSNLTNSLHKHVFTNHLPHILLAQKTVRQLNIKRNSTLTSPRPNEASTTPFPINVLTAKVISAQTSPVVPSTTESENLKDRLTQAEGKKIRWFKRLHFC